MHYEILQQHGLFSFESVRRDLRTVRERISEVHILNDTISEKLVDLVAIAAAEFSILDFEESPTIYIESPHVFRAIRKIDTLLLFPCRSVWRWFIMYRIYLSDVFLFVADLQKAESILENMDMDIENLNLFRVHFSSFANLFVRAQLINPLSNDLINLLSNDFPLYRARFELALKVQTVIWNLRLGLLFSLSENQNQESTGRLIEELEIRSLIRQVS